MGCDKIIWINLIMIARNVISTWIINQHVIEGTYTLQLIVDGWEIKSIKKVIRKNIKNMKTCGNNINTNKWMPIHLAIQIPINIKCLGCYKKIH